MTDCSWEFITKEVTCYFAAHELRSLSAQGWELFIAHPRGQSSDVVGYFRRPVKSSTTVDSPMAAETARPEISVLVDRWGRDISTKWKEVRATKGQAIAVYQPALGYASDVELRKQTSVELLPWTREWFASRGYDVDCQIKSDGESIEITRIEKKDASV